MTVVLKGKFIGQETLKASRFSLADIRAEANEILERARAELDRARGEAEKIVADAKTHADHIRGRAEREGAAAGHQKGFDEGRREGSAQGLEEARKTHAEQSAGLKKALTGVLERFEQQRHELVGAAHQELLALAVAIAEKIIRRRVESDPQDALALVKSAIDLIVSRGAARVRMNAADLERLNLLDPDQAQRLTRLRDIAFVADDGVEPGGCMITTAGGELDARIATQIDTIVRHLVPTMAGQIAAWTGAAKAESAGPKAEEHPQTNVAAPPETASAGESNPA